VFAATLATPLSAQTAAPTTATPIKYLVVIFNENNSFDHYFATYPNAANLTGEQPFIALPDTPSVNGLTPAMIANNPNSTKPYRIAPGVQTICDNDNHYADEQKAYDNGLLDKFPESTNGSGCPAANNMGFYDGNTVTAFWNYAQHFAMSDNFFDTEFGTTVMGHLNLISGQTHQTGVTTVNGKIANGSIIANVEAGYDDCTGAVPTKMTSKNVGDLLNKAGVSWGWFYDSFARLGVKADGTTAVCNSVYNNHYDPFQYYGSTSNPHHLPPTSVDVIGASADQANHQYDLANFWDAAVYGTLPAVSFIKFQSLYTGHPTDSTALQEQRYLVQTINALQRLPQWPNMAILITYDDSDGFYDHVMPPIVNQSNDPGQDTAMCGTAAPDAYLDRCGYGTRLPFVVISPFAKQNFVDRTTTDTTSILRFIEDNWNLGRLGDQSFDALSGSIMNMFNFTGQPAPQLFLDPATGSVVAGR